MQKVEAHTQFQPQYDPSSDFGVFGVADNKLGGMLKDEKANAADLVVDKQPSGVSQPGMSMNPASTFHSQGLTVPGTAGGETGSHNDTHGNRSPHSSSGAVSPHPLIEGQGSSSSLN
mmetsp:Transcript_41470/g.63277  ORF Transcript_41470/g.63277 Transcript_41470/m.63277 type:complete len:117 (+) Transcript_41470:1545-1895(+)